LQLLIAKYPDKVEYINELKSALKWVADSYRSTLAGKSVRNADEIFAYVKHLLTE